VVCTDLIDAGEFKARPWDDIWCMGSGRGKLLATHGVGWGTRLDLKWVIGTITNHSDSTHDATRGPKRALVALLVLSVLAGIGWLVPVWTLDNGLASLRGHELEAARNALERARSSCADSMVERAQAALSGWSRVEDVDADPVNGGLRVEVRTYTVFRIPTQRMTVAGRTVTCGSVGAEPARQG
jgi:hypothetical protein